MASYITLHTLKSGLWLLIQVNQRGGSVGPLRKQRKAPNVPNLDSLPTGNLFAVWGVSFSVSDFEPAFASPLQFDVSPYGNQVLI